jgi:hypothetical protein
MAAKCPKCEKPFSSVRCEHITVNAPGGKWNGVSYACPLCSSALSVGIDPIAIKTDIVKDILKALRK